MEILVLFILTLLNGFFALSEIALVSVKRPKVEHLASLGNNSAKIILELLEKPENFLSSVQVGITLIGIISGAYGGATLTDDMNQLLLGLGFPPTYTEVSSLIVVIGAITYFSIVIGELVPKTLAMNNAEPIALACAPTIKYFTLATYPFVKLLSASTNILVRIFGIKVQSEENISEEELRFMLKTAGKQGVLAQEESQVHQNIFSFSDQTAKSLLTHRSDVEWINLLDGKEKIFNKLKESVHSKFVVSEGQIDQVKGIVRIKNFLENFQNENFTFESILEEPIFVSENTQAFHILKLFKDYKQYIAIVVDEYGGVEGIVTLHDLFEAIIGDLPDEDEDDQASIVKREDGSYLLEGRTLVYEINQYFQRMIIAESPYDYTTVAGYIQYHIGAIPQTGQLVPIESLQFEIIDMDGLRIDKILMKDLSGSIKG